jgi:hypothetical protein
MLLSELQIGQRYFFYYNDNLFNDGIVNTYIFRAEFVNIINNSLILNKYSIRGILNQGFWTMPIDWVENIETLEEITLSKIPLPSDILLIIDNFLV